jgi:hypothetical protein
MANKSKKPLALLTSCTVTRNTEPLLKIGDMEPCDTMADLCDQWCTAMHTYDEGSLKSPGEIYAGTAMTAITEIAQDIGHENIFIVTGGVGLVRHTDYIVPYDFTADRKQLHNAHQKVTGERFIPHVWWGKINKALHGDPDPIRKLLDEYEFVVGALPKMFTKYILADLESCGPQERESRVFIPMTSSMYNGVPNIIKDAYVPYTPEYLADILYSRGDKAQRVVQKFLRQAANDNLAETANKMLDIAANTTPANKGHVDYAEMFAVHPDIVEAEDVHTAMYRAKAFGYKIGGNARFAGAWRSHQGQIEPPKITAVRRKEGASVLQGIISAGDRMSDDDKILERLSEFIAVVKDVDQNLVFSAKEIVTWAKTMYPGELEGMDNTNKVSYLLGYNAGYLGVEELKIGSRKGFRLLA